MNDSKGFVQNNEIPYSDI
jgi:serine/threonine protein kinase